MIALLLLACADKNTDTGAVDDWVAPVGGVVALTTEDGVALEADYYPAARGGAPAYVLLHMIPPNWDRTSWPLDFIAALQEDGASVVVPDRRGAGGSGGEATDAYQGENGKYDVAACVDLLVADGAGDLVIIGASNGTTSALDYTVWAQAGNHLAPAALGFMTGGPDTEKNTAMDALGPTPAIFTFSTEERSWSVEQRSLDPGSWSFVEYADGDHGTLMFAAAPEVSDDLVGYFDAVVGD